MPRLLTALVVIALLAAGCGAAPGPARVAPTPGSGFGAGSGSGPVTRPLRPVAPVPCPDRDGWSCQQRRRFDAVAEHLRAGPGAHGYLSVVFTDRTTGASWRYGPSARPGWTASTVKLAMATDLLDRQRAGAITLSDADRGDMATMLNFSDEAASDRLWARYGGADMLARLRDRFGMAGLRFVPGFSARPYWGFVKCDADDLAALLREVFTRTDPADRAYLVAAMRGVAPNQRWGVWAAGPAQRPGNKDGWSDETDDYGRHWVTNTVGFAGPGERYLVAVMYQLDPAGSLADGVHTVSDVVALLFGQPVPAPVSMPLPDG